MLGLVQARAHAGHTIDGSATAWMIAEILDRCGVTAVKEMHAAILPQRRRDVRQAIARALENGKGEALALLGYLEENDRVLVANVDLGSLGPDAARFVPLLAQGARTALHAALFATKLYSVDFWAMSGKWGAVAARMAEVKQALVDTTKLDDFVLREVLLWWFRGIEWRCIQYS